MLEQNTEHRRILEWNTNICWNGTQTRPAVTYVVGHLLILLHHALILLVHVEDLANTLGGLLSLSRAGEGVVVGGDIGHDGTLIRLGSGGDVCVGIIKLNVKK